MERQPRIDLLVIQPTPFCNLDCDYCYLPSRNDTRRIARDTLEQVYARVFKSGLLSERLTIVWHAGEPMVMPIEFYREAFGVASDLKPKQIVLDHSFQTNGFFINKDWCEFTKESGLRLGVSLDGPPFLHDAHRKTRHGRGTHMRVMEGLRLLQESEIDFHVITVLTRNSLQYPDELFDFYVGNGITRVAFNIEEIEGVNRTSSLAGPGVDDEFKRFVSRFFSLLKDSEHAISVREFDSAFGAACSPAGAPINNHQVMPFGIVSVDCLGNISTFSPELLGQRNDVYHNFTFGNVRDGPLSLVESNSAFRKLNRDIQEGIMRCRESCAYFNVCGGGAPANKYYEHGTFTATETLYCRLTKKAIIDLVLEEVENSPAPSSLSGAPGDGFRGDTSSATR